MSREDSKKDGWSPTCCFRPVVFLSKTALRAPTAPDTEPPDGRTHTLNAIEVTTVIPVTSPVAKFKTDVKVGAQPDINCFQL